MTDTEGILQTETTKSFRTAMYMPRLGFWRSLLPVSGRSRKKVRPRNANSRDNGAVPGQVSQSRFPRGADVNVTPRSERASVGPARRLSVRPWRGRQDGTVHIAETAEG
jgi:hypothetical protein